MMAFELDELDKELADLENDKTEKPAKKKGGAKTLPIVVAAFALLSFGGIVFYAYHQGVRSGSEEAAPLLTPNGVAKIQPDDPGGLEVPHKDKLVYNRVEAERDDSNVERLLPPPEDPMQPPAPEEVMVNATPPIPSIIETPVASTKKTETPPLPEPELKAPDAPPSPVVVKTSPAPVIKKVVEATPTLTPVNIPKNWRIQISAVKSEDAAKAEWAKAQKANSDLLGKLKLEIQKIDISGKTYYRVRGGPIKDKITAQTLCNKLKAKKTACIIVKPNV